MSHKPNRYEYGALEVIDSTDPTHAEKKRLKPIAYWICIALLIAGCVGIYVLTQIAPSSPGYIQNKQWRRMEESHPANVPSKWVEKEECGDHTFTLTFAIKQGNMDRLHQHVMSVSDPVSGQSFHQYWDVPTVQEYFAPEHTTLKAVTEWLEDNGLSVDNGRMPGVVRVELTCHEANELLDAKYMFYEHSETGKRHLRVQDGVYNIPDAIFEHIDFIEPTMRFPMRHHTREMTKLDLSEEEITALKSRASEEANYVTPAKLYSLYGMSNSLLSMEGGNSFEIKQAVASFLDEYWDEKDLELAWENLGYMGDNSLSQMSRVPKSQPSGYGSEAELDVQYITATAPGMDTIVYFVDDESDPFLTLSEEIYESPVKPSVISISYGGDEYEMGEQYVQRINQEFGKLALMGITILASAGDSGTRGDDNDCYRGTQYIASFPASAPYVTAVGGVTGGTKNSKGSTGEIAWLYGGGGFSTMFNEPDWQNNAISHYFSQKIDFPEADRYQKGMRGMPDLAAQASDFVIAVKGDWYLVSGTSASCPAVAGMVSMINMERLKSGKETLGFLNPSLYSMYDSQDDFNEKYNDVTEGYNEGCRIDNDIGWSAAKGWDPVTGVGTPKFDELFSNLRDI